MQTDRSDQRSSGGWLVHDSGETFFADTTEGHRRSIVFAIAIASGALATMGATSALVTASEHWPIGVVLGTVALSAYAFGALIALGWWPFLFADHQLLWRN